MDYSLSLHAEATVRKRRISVAWVERALSAPVLVLPDRTDATIEHRLIRIPEFGNRVLRVVVKTTVFPINVVTLYFDRNMKSRL